MKPERNRSRELGFYVLILVILAATVFSMLGGKKQAETTYSDLADLFRAEKVQSFVTRGDEIELREEDEDDIVFTAGMHETYTSDDGEILGSGYAIEDETGEDISNEAAEALDEEYENEMDLDYGPDDDDL